MSKTQLFRIGVVASLLCVTFTYNTYAQVAGALDSTFNNTGFVMNVITPTTSLGSNGTSVAVQNDGKIIVTGVSTNNNLLLARYNADGTIDNGFGVNGIVETDFGSIEEANDIVLQNDGRIVIGGRSGPIPDPAMLVARYNTDGTVDASFGTNGRTVIDYLNRREVVRSIAIAPDGGIVGIGETSPSMGIDSFVVMVIKLRPDGLPDSTFGGDGIALLPHTDDMYGFGVAVQPDGKVIAGGYINSLPPSVYSMEMLVARFNADGTTDPTFGTAGITKIHFGASDDQSLGYSLALQSDGKILIGGDNRRPAQGIGPELALARLNANGTPDISFGTNGQTLTIWGDDKLVHCGSIALQSDGRIVAGGYTFDTLTNITYIALARYKANGTIDSSFNGNGKISSLVSQADRARKTVIQADGKIVIGGHSYDGSLYYTTIARYHSGALSSVPHEIRPLKNLSVQPNPVGASSTLKYALTSAGHVDVCVVDESGRVVRRLAGSDQAAGGHTIPLTHLSSLPAGMYMIYVTTARESGSVKIVID